MVVKITQFADDTLIFLRSFQVLARVWKVLDMYQEATAMNANTSKFEALRAGSLKAKERPYLTTLYLRQPLLTSLKRANTYGYLAFRSGKTVSMT